MSSNAEKPKLFMLLSRFPYPLEKGDKLRGFYQLRALSQHFDIVLVCLTDQSISEEAIAKVRPFCVDLHVFKLNKIFIYLRLILHIFSKLPFQVAYFHSRKAHSSIKSILNDHRPNYIYSQLIRTSEYIKNYHDCPKTIDYMDALSIGMERRAMRSPGIRRFIFQEEAKRLRNYERKVFDYFEGHSIISEQDRTYILHPDRNKIAIIANGIDKTFFEVNSEVPTHDLVFIGNLSYAPNIDAADFLLKELLPELPTKTLLLAGATPDPELSRNATRCKNATLLGWTDDIRKTYRKGKIFIAPMQIGTGMQNKLLEAMALGIPCITTSLANNAIKGVHREHLMVANDKKEMIQCILELENNPDLRESLIQNARNYVLENYSWDSTVTELKKIISH